MSVWDPVRIAVVAMDDNYLGSLCGFADVVEMANGYIHRRQKEVSSGLNAERTGIAIELLSMDGQPVPGVGGFTVPAQHSIESKTDPYQVVFLPAIRYAGQAAFNKKLKALKPLCAWLETQWENGAILAANGASIFLLAEAGLLNNRPATIGWWLEEHFRQRYPAVKLDVSRQVTEADNIFCASTPSANLYLACHLVEHLTSHTIGGMTEKTVFAHADGESLPYYTAVSEPAASDDALVAKAQYWLQKNYSRKVGLADLAKTCAVSERTLIRRFKQSLGITPHAYLRALRIETATRMLLHSGLRISQIGERIGYADIDFFKRVFRQHTGLTPGDYRTRFAPARQHRKLLNAPS